MAISSKTFVEAKYAENAQTTQYTAPTATKSIIDKATVTNVSASAATLSVNLVESGGAASAADLVLKAKAIQPNETYTLPELIGQVLETGDFISTLASAASALVIRLSGREIT